MYVHLVIIYWCSYFPTHFYFSNSLRVQRLQSVDALPEDCLLVTLDVSSLYTSSPHNKVIDACREMLDTRGVLSPPTEDIIELISLILTKNNFTFNALHYL